MHIQVTLIEGPYWGIRGKNSTNESFGIYFEDWDAFQEVKIGLERTPWENNGIRMRKYIIFMKRLHILLKQRIEKGQAWSRMLEK